MQASRVAAANASAVQRAAPGRALPSSRQSAPPTIGSQTSRLSSGKAVLVMSGMRSVPKEEQDAEQRDQAQDHGEGVVVQVTGLRPAQQRRGQAGQAHAAVDEEAVDHLLVV